jgi:hypothetical protein
MPYQETSRSRRRAAAGPTPSPDRETASDVVVTSDEAKAVQRQRKQTEAQKAQARKLIDEMLECYRKIDTAESQLRRDMREDLEFVQGDQWPPEIKARREKAGRPCLTTNRLPQFIRLVTNQARASKPGIQINPVDSGADPETAQVLQDICRHVEVSSDADIAYERAAEHQAQMGRGYIGVVTEYDDDEGFTQRIKIRGFRNPFRVFLEMGDEVDGKDAERAIVIDDYDRSEFTRRWPFADLVSLESLRDEQTLSIDWADGQKIRVAEYWYTRYEEQEIVDVELTNEAGQRESMILLRKVLDDLTPEDRASLALKEWRARTVKRRRVYVALCSGAEILDGNAERTAGIEWPSKYIPIVPVLGDEVELNGKVDYRGMVRNAKDPQRMYNYWVSAITEAIALAPRAPWVGTKGQFKGLEKKWATANTDAHAFLQYNEVTSGGRYAPPPQRRVEEPAIQAMVMALRQADNDLKAVMGLYDASLGQRGPEESGVAVQTRQRQGEIANSNFGDNQARAIRQVGRIIVDLAPKIMDVATVMRLRGDDGKAREVTVYSNPNPQLPADGSIPDLRALKEAETAGKIYNIGVGRYDVSVSVGPSFKSRRQEAVEAILSIINSNPNVAPYVLDLLFRNSDWPDAKLIADRFERMVPAQARDPQDGAPPIPPEVQKQLELLQQQLQEVQAAYEEAKRTLEAKQVETAGKVQVAKVAGEAAVTAEGIRQQGAQALAALEGKIAEYLASVEARNDQMLAILEARLESMQIKLEAREDARVAREEARIAERSESSPKAAA